MVLVHYVGTGKHTEAKRRNEKLYAVLERLNYRDSRKISVYQGGSGGRQDQGTGEA